MKTNTLILIFLFATSYFTQAQISQQQLFKYSRNFIERQQLNEKEHHEPYKLTSLNNESGKTYAYIVNLKPKGFIVFSPTEELYPILSFSTESDFNYINSNENTLLQMIEADQKRGLDIIARQLNKKQKKEILKNREAWNKLEGNETQKLTPQSKTSTANTSTLIQYGKHLSSIWGGVNCYDQDSLSIHVGNYYTPNHYSPGCVATSLSMILHYYKWPESGVGTHTNYDNKGSSQTSWTANFENAQYDYDNMLDEYMYKVSNDSQQKAMGYISFHTATALDMDYEASGSTSHINRIPKAANSYFRFSGHYQTPSWNSFWERFHENLRSGIPIPIAIYATNGAGHAPVCDGYRYNEGDSEGEYYYHLNMGWWGTNNAWYRLQGSFNAGGYTSVTGAVFDLLPDPVFTEITTTPSKKSFILNWKTSDKLNWDTFELQESINGQPYTTIDNNITTTSYSHSVANGGTYSYRVRAKSNGFYYLNSYSEPIEIKVPYDLTFLDFDGNDSFFVYDNFNNDFDVTTTYTFETWIKIDNRANNTYPVVMDRKGVFSLYLIDDSDADYGVKFVTRNSSGNIIASLQSDNSTENLYFNQWAHIAITRSNNITNMFVNGIKVDNSNDPDFVLSTSTNALNIGARYWNGYERYLDGKIDKIRISEVSRYNNNFTPNLLEQYSNDNYTKILLALDEGIGIEISDGAGNFNIVQLRPSPNQPNWMFDNENQTQNKQAPIKLIISDNDYQNERNTPIAMSLYPNPAQNIISYTIEADSNQYGQIKIYNNTGLMVINKSYNLKKGTNNMSLDISKLVPGLYFSHFNSDYMEYKASFIKN